jgi:hypothetical protein
MAEGSQVFGQRAADGAGANDSDFHGMGVKFLLVSATKA